MLKAISLLVVGIGSLSCCTGCGEATSIPAKVAVVDPFRLASEPVGAVEVLDAKKQAQDGESVVIVGRIGGGIKPWVEGRAAFLLVDSRSEASCDDDACEAGCPACARELAASSTMVKFLGDDGKVLPTDARELLGVKEKDMVVIQGVAHRDETGNVSVAAEGLFIRR